MGLGDGVQVVLPTGQHPSLHFFSPVHILGSHRNPCPSSPALLPGLEDAEKPPRDAVASVKPLIPLSLAPQPLPSGIQKVKPSSYLVARWSGGSFPPLVTRWSGLSLKAHTEGMRSTKRSRQGCKGTCVRWEAGVQHPQRGGSAVIQTGRGLRQIWELSRELSEMQGDKDRLVWPP